MYFIEFMEPRPGVPVDRFERVVKDYLEGWACEHPEDRLVLTAGRQWWLGPEPAYVTIWAVDDLSAFERWRDELATPEAAARNEEFEAVARIVQAGLYDDL